MGAASWSLPRFIGVIAVALLVLLPLGTRQASAGGGQPVLRVRKNVKDLTPQEKRDYVNAVLALKRVRSPWDPRLSYYDQFVSWHVQTARCSIDAAHMHASFLPWHREFLLLFENALRQVSGKPITVPYWDFTDPVSTAAVFSNDFMGGAGDPHQAYAVTTGPFRKGKWNLAIVDPESMLTAAVSFGRPHYLTRAFGTYRLAKRLPTAAEITQVMKRPQYDVPPYDATSDVSLSFRNALEGWRNKTGMECSKGEMIATPSRQPIAIHNMAHVWVGGLFGDPKHPTVGTMTENSSPDDPVFFLLHSYIDLLWSRWEQAHGFSYRPVSGAMYGYNLHDTMWPYRTVGIRTTIANLLDEKALGYEYDTEVSKR